MQDKHSSRQEKRPEGDEEEKEDNLEKNTDETPDKHVMDEAGVLDRKVTSALENLNEKVPELRISGISEEMNVLGALTGDADAAGMAAAMAI